MVLQVEEAMFGSLACLMQSRVFSGNSRKCIQSFGLTVVSLFNNRDTLGVSVEDASLHDYVLV
jgi:hypothetical protein